MPPLPTYTAAQALAIYNDYWKVKGATLDSVATKHNINRMTVHRIARKTGRFNARVLEWAGVTITLEQPERQMNRAEMERAAGGP
jgi:hypothetical protein